MQVGLNTSPKTAAQNPDKINRFFDVLDGTLSGLASRLGLPRSYIEGLSAYESGYYDDHNLALNNPFGLTQAGRDNIKFSSIGAAVSYWISIFERQVTGATSASDFAQRLEGILNGQAIPGWHRYNSANSAWESGLVNVIGSVDSRRNNWLNFLFMQSQKRKKEEN